jgi:putrescine transport system permease protein
MCGAAVVWLTIWSCDRSHAGSWLLAFTLSLDDLVIASFVTGLSATTLPMAVFSSVRLGVSPEVNALRRCSSLSSSCWWRSPFG